MAENAELAVVAGDAIESPILRAPTLRLARLSEWGGFAGVVLLALALNAWHLNRNGDGNTYYAAAVRSMTASWSNFFFGAFDPGGFITVDKPPAFLWVGALSARIFGYSSWSILMPSAVAGAATAGLLWLIVRRYFGPLAGTIAGAALALTPITVAVSRLNLPEPILILALLGAVGAILASLESRRWLAWTLLAGFLVGVAFNTKMLAAWIPGPALALAVLVAYPELHRAATLRRVVLQLGVLLASTLVVSGSWMLVVDHWPGDRPYIGGSKDNTVQNLVLDYNGVGRVEGNEGPGAGRPANNNGPTANPGAAPFRPNGTQANRTQLAPGGGINGPGGIIAGNPGLWRMFDASNGPQVAWLLPAALLGAGLALAVWWRDRRARAAIVLFAGWVLSFGLVFSFAKGIYHSYYTSAMAPGVAALFGITGAAAVHLGRRDRRWLWAFVPVVIATIWVQFGLAGHFPDHQSAAKPLAILAVAAGAALAGALAMRRTRLGLAPGMAAVAVGLLVMPSAWSLYEATHASINTTLPQAGPREGAAGRSFGSSAFDGGVPALATWVESHADSSARWQLVTASAQNASTLIARYGLSVMALGGFSGSDPTISVSQFADMVSAGEVRYVLATQGGPGGIRDGAANAPDGARNPINGPTSRNAAPDGTGLPNFGGAPRGTLNPGAAPPPGGPGFAAAPAGGSATNGANAVITAVRSVCTPVTGADAPAGYQGSLYDCAGNADRLRRLGQ